MNNLIPLKKGSKIGIAASSSHFKKEEFEKGIKLLKESGYKPIYSDNIFLKDGLFSGTAKERVQDFNCLISQKDINTIFFVRGGYGSVEMLPLLKKLDLSKKIKGKIFMGYSDVTALFCHLYQKYRTPMFYGPNIISRHLDTKILDCLSEPKDLKIKVQILRPGAKNISADLFGGCLSVITSLAGTQHLGSFKGKILFIEDTNEAPHRIDRMLTQLLMSGTIKGIKAIAVGSMENCDTQNYGWKNAVLRIAEEMDIPVISGINAGHGSFDYPLPIGTKARIDFTNKEFLIYSPFKNKNKERLSRGKTKTVR